MLIGLYLLLEVLHPLGDRLGDLEIVLDLLHGGSTLGLLHGILGQGLVSVLELLDLLFLEVDLGHLPVIVSQLLVVIVVGWLLVFLQLVDWLLLLWYLLALGEVHGLLDPIIILAIDDGLSLSLSYLCWILLSQLSCCLSCVIVNLS